MSNETPFRIQIGDYALLEWVGQPSLDLIKQALHQIISHPEFRKGMPVIYVDRHSSYNPSAGEIHVIAFEMKSRKDQLGPLAMVVRSPLHLGISNMLRVYCQMEGIRFQVFRELEEAAAWVREESDNPPPLKQTAGA